MANYTSTANVVLSVNGKQAQQMLSSLEKDAKRLETKLAAAAKAGDKASMKKLQRDLNNTNRLMDQLRGASASTERVLSRLDKATPRELQKTLRQLKNELNGIERGSAAWDAQIEKIKAVKNEIKNVNSTMREQESLSDRVMNWINKWQMALLAVGAAITGLVMAGRKAVQAYADMDQEMANTRKFTGMSAEEVDALNEELKKIDTRTSREELNKLAQEAGRLGKSSQEDVLGYVRAADKINVALDDLGSGATLTISKLTGIFGDEQRLGTEKAMLSVGSVINELSQNCSASAPYIAEFASRMGGVGAQAGMTVQQIMGLAAVLDSNNQKLEASSTALSQVIVRIYQDPAKYARVAGMDVQKFADLVKTDMNAALIEFLSTLKRAGSMDVLSPMFKDMGENGSRAISALSTLANHIDEVKSQQLVANEAFAEATSIGKEAEIQNNTVQAQLDKAKNRVHELAVELGEKLQPVMRLVISSTTIALKALSAMVTFFSKHKTDILALGVAIAAFTVTVKASAIATALHAAKTAIATAAQKAWTVAVTLSKIAVNLFTLNLKAASTAAATLNKTLKKNIFGLIAAGVAYATVKLIDFCSKSKKVAEEYTRAAKINEQAANKFKESSKSIQAETKSEIKTLDALYKAATDEARSKDERRNAAEKLIKLYPEYFKKMNAELIMVGKAKVAYDDLKKSILAASKARVNQAAIDANNEAITEHENSVENLQNTLYDKYTEWQNEKALLDNMQAEYDYYEGIIGPANTLQQDRENILSKLKSTLIKQKNKVDTLKNQVEYYQNAISEHQENIDSLNQKNDELAEVVVDNMVSNTSTDFSDLEDVYYTPYVSEKDRKKREREKAAAARRAEIKARKEFKEALDVPKAAWESDTAQNVSDYSAGLKSWSDFLLRKHEIELKYFTDREEVYQRFNHTEDEDYQELLKKKAEYEAEWIKKNAALKVEEAKRMQQAEETQAQMDFYTPGNALYGKEEALQQKLFEIRIKYLKQVQAAYNNFSEEWHNYQVQIDQAEGEEQLRRQKLLAQRIAEWKKKYEYKSAKERYDLENELMLEAYDKGLISYREYLDAQRDLKKKYDEDYLPESAKPSQNSSEEEEAAKKKDLDKVKSLYEQGLLSKDQYEKAKDRIEKSYFKKSTERARSFGSEQTNMLLDIYEAWKNFFDGTEEDGGNWATRLAALAKAVFAVMNAGMQQYSEYTSACSDLEVAKAEKKYDREIELAEGNSYKVKKAEKQKEYEIAKIKSDAAKKQFAMQVIQAVVQTATNALNAFGSAAAVPVIGYILAPIAAAMAVAAGMMQIATIKKQQQAAEAQGYSEGGFTPSGGKDKPVGVVHAGEWVASQKLVNNPKTRPLLEALDYAQRTNSIGSITHSDVSRSITAPMMIAASPQSTKAPAVTNNYYSGAEENGEYAAIMRRLADRLDKPFVTVNTVSGDNGIQKAQDDYSRLMKNKSPKSRK